jgi:hypothetical protein
MRIKKLRHPLPTGASFASPYTADALSSSNCRISKLRCSNELPRTVFIGISTTASYGPAFDTLCFSLNRQCTRWQKVASIAAFLKESESMVQKGRPFTLVLWWDAPSSGQVLLTVKAGAAREHPFNLANNSDPIVSTLGTHDNRCAGSGYERGFQPAHGAYRGMVGMEGIGMLMNDSLIRP